MSKPDSQRWARDTRRNMLLLGCALILIGAAAIPMFIGEALLKWNARNWPEARARITGASLSRGSITSLIFFGETVEVRFFYSVLGATYDTTQVIPAALAEKLGVVPPTGHLEQRQPNIRTTCFYNPDNPREALVTRDWSRRDLRALLPLVPAAFGVGVILRGRRVAREAQDPAGQLRLRNEDEWDVQPAGSGFRCVPKRRAGGLSIGGIADMFKGEPLAAIELLDYPLRRDGENRIRIDRPTDIEPRKIVIHLEVMGRLNDTKRSTQIVESTGNEPPKHVLTFAIPPHEQSLDASSNLRLRITPEAGLFVSPPRFLWVQIAPDDATRTAAAR